MPSRRTKTQSPLRAFKDRVRGAGNNLLYAIDNGRKRLPATEYVNALTWLRSTPQAERFFAAAFPTSISTMNTAPFLSRLDLSGEVAWCAALLSVHADDLATYVDRRVLYEQALLGGDYVTCLSILNDLDKTLGPSLFTIEQRIAVLQRASGLKAQKDYTDKVRATRGANDIVSFFAFYVSQRNEQNTTAGRFAYRVDRLLSDWSPRPGIAAYIRFRLLAELPSEATMLAELLGYEQVSSLVDLYETLIAVLCNLLIREDEHFARIALRAVQACAATFADGRLERALSMSTGRLPHAQTDVEAYSCLLKGDWSTAVQLCRAEGLAGSRSSWYLDALACALGRLPPREDKTVSGSIARSMASIVNRDEDYDDRLDRLHKLVMNHHACGFAADITYAAAAEVFNTVPAVRSKDVLEAYILTGRPLFSHVFETLDASGSSAFSERDRLLFNYLQAMRGNTADTSSFDGSIEPEFSALASSTMYFGQGDFEQALSHARPLLTAEPYFQRQGARLASRCLLELNRRPDAAEIVVRQALNDPYSINILPLSEVSLPLQDKVERRNCARSLITPIVLDLYARHVGDDLRKIRGYAYDEFLRSQGLRTPTELRGTMEDHDSQLLTYYLKHICVSQNMQASPTFTSINELENERIGVCNMLAELDPNNRQDYIDEAVAIARDKAIREAMVQAEQSKIYIDEGALHAWAERDLQESFARYKALSRLSRSQENALERIKIVLADTPGSGDSLRIFKVPTHESIALLNDTIADIVKAALTSPEFGLDSYLGTRIRHGTLSAKMRNALVEHNLITQRRSANAPYSPNAYWLGKFADELAAVREMVAARLNAFSADFDRLVDAFAKEQIQIKSDEKPRGLFPATISDDSITQIITAVSLDATFSEFVDLCLDATLNEIETSLKRVVDVIDQELKPRIAELLTHLERDIAELVSDHREFDRSVRTARTDTINLLKQIKDWFQLGRATSEPTLSLDELVEASVRTVKTLHPDFHITLLKDLPEIHFPNALTRFTDILFQVLDNVWLYSRCATPVVRISGSYTDGRLRMRIESDIDPSVRTREAEAGLESIRKDIASPAYQHATRTEGKSGLKKVFRSINQGQNSRAILLFDFLDNEKFFVEVDFEIPRAEMLADDDHISY